MGRPLSARRRSELNTFALDASLQEWSEIAEFDWSGLLVGNGASMAVWPRFGYVSLHDQAQRDELEHSLGAADVELFERLETTNFETVLSALQIAKMVASALDLSQEEIAERHEAIRLALVSAVHSVHISWSSVPDATLATIRKAMLQFQWVYSTNYDLLLYWAIMQDDPYPFPDYFWSQPFNISDTQVARKATRVLFLHGGLHLHRDILGRTYKRSAGAQNLLESFGELTEEGFTPLFVAEGSAEEKMRAIRRSDYLTFAYKSLSDHSGNLVVFGSALRSSDSHLLDALRQWRGRTIGIGFVPGQPDADVIEKKARLQRELPNAGLVYFDASTFPLGAEALRATEE